MTASPRIERLRQRMAETGTDLVAIGPSSHMVYLTGVDPHGDERPVMLLVSPTYAGFLMPALNLDAARKNSDLPMIPWSDSDGPDAALAQVLEATGIDRTSPSVVLDETMRADFALLLLDALPGARRRFTGDTVSFLRARKDEDEYRRLKASQLLNDKAMQAGFAALKPGVTERDVASVIRSVYLENGARPQFDLVCFGENGAFPHHHTGDTVLKAGDAVLLDIGGRLDGYPSDMTRVAHLGEPSAEFAKVHAVVNTAVEAALASVRPGVKASAVDDAARGVIAQAGYGEFFLHRTGHGLGLDIHEPPYITATSDTVLEEGMVFSIEPGIYLAGRFGIRLEEVVIVRSDGPEILSELPRDTVIV
ncbi:Xaa-Pro peptidase family protein [Pelagibacterium sp. 26DY04]|uniref:M24 family metallopeptidase n=1 Tax=Pelagibacterium sp. 26DY04 TaxID=2967130 RepID=UPI00281616EE|nr:Xaa-Pro peptidase family protein [Pelagibacterium sp. 26DY04]WMT86869.1 Xaa-Pro peptidase family protein [Pelagibacterium sp. 26DY04]